MPRIEKLRTLTIDKPGQLVQQNLRTKPKLGLLKGALRLQDSNLKSLLSCGGMKYQKCQSKNARKVIDCKFT